MINTKSLKFMKGLGASLANIGNLQKTLANAEVDGSAAGGLVTIRATCSHVVKKVTISPELLKEDADVVADVFAAAMNDVTAKIELRVKESLGPLGSMIGK